MDKCKWLIADGEHTKPRQWAWYHCQEDNNHIALGGKPHKAAIPLGKQPIFKGGWFLPEPNKPVSTIQTCPAFLVNPRWFAYDFNHIDGSTEEQAVVFLIRNGNRVQWYGIEVFLVGDTLSASKEKPPIPIFGGK